MSQKVIIPKIGIRVIHTVVLESPLKCHESDQDFIISGCYKAHVNVDI